MKEQDIIEIFYNTSNYPKDDCFFDTEGELKSAQGQILVTTDGMASGVHFLTSWSSPEDIAIKLVEVNVSDMVSSGGIAKYAFLNLGLSETTREESWIRRFALAIQNQLSIYNIRLVGGDTFRVDSEQTVLNLTLVGNLHPKLKNPILRTGGEPGDYLFISGSVGFSQLGLEQLLRGQVPSDDIQIRAEFKHKRPKSRHDLLDLLVEIPVHACMDITDGLVQDLQKLSTASKLRLRIELERLPDYQTLLPFIGIDGIITSGEELELLVLAPSHSMSQFLSLGFTWIGESIFQDDSSSSYGIEFLENGKIISINNEGFFHFQ